MSNKKEKARKRLLAAQDWKTHLINGREFPRIPFGEETFINAGGYEANDEKCGCTAMKGQFHCNGCRHEGCPACGMIAWECDCESYYD